MPSTENFRRYQENLRALFTILQDAVSPIVDKHVEEWDYYNRDEEFRIMYDQNIDDMRDAVSPKLDELSADIEPEILNGVLKVIANFRLYRSFNYPGVGSDILAIRQKQLNKRGVA